MSITQTIKDICVPLAEYPHLPDTATLRDAFAILREGFATGKRFRHALVLDQNGRLVGILGIRDILRGMFPDYLRTKEHAHHEAPIPDFPALTLIWAQTCETQCPVATNKRVTDFMAPVPGKVNAGDPLTKAAYLLVVHDTSMLPVVDGQKLIGVVRMVDVFNEAAKVVLHG